MKSQANHPPSHLDAPGRALWAAVAAEFVVDDAAGRALLTLACEALDRCRQAQAVLKSSGPTTTDQRGALKAHPCIAIERDAWGVMQRALRQLDLSPEIVAKPGRPAKR
jgi:P27 family predicted phage terminase small subunit